MPDTEKNKVQMRKGVLVLCILAILEQGEAYASDIISAMKDVRLLVVEGTLYPLLTRLKNEGLLEYRWQESISGPPRKYYRLTMQGTESLKELKDSWLNLNESVNKIITKGKEQES